MTAPEQTQRSVRVAQTVQVALMPRSLRGLMPVTARVNVCLSSYSFFLIFFGNLVLCRCADLHLQISLFCLILIFPGIMDSSSEYGTDVKLDDIEMESI